MNKIITIDGPAGSGKSTVSRLLAKKLGVLYLDTGAMFRAVALQAKRMRVDPQDGEEMGLLCRHLDLRFEKDGTATRLYMDGEDISLAIRTPEMDMFSSKISALREVREAMAELQRKIGRKRELVAEGRDMGTVVFPNACCKFFVTASLEVRARRRYRERLDRGEAISEKDVTSDLCKRDEQDSTRAIAPLRPAEDAVIIDTSDLTVNEAVERMLQLIHNRWV